MLSALRRAWNRYLASLPHTEEPEPLSDAEIRRAMHAPHPPAVLDAFTALAGLVTAHLPPDVAAKSRAALCARLKRGIAPTAALARWISSHSAPKSRNLGLMCLDWKAREEIAWQAERIAKAHAVALDWRYDFRSDRAWEGWEERGEAPVSAPLRDLAGALRGQGLALLVFSDDDTVCAFAVGAEHDAAARALCAQLAIVVEGVSTPPGG